MPRTWLLGLMVATMWSSPVRGELAVWPVQEEWTAPHWETLRIKANSTFEKYRNSPSALTVFYPDARLQSSIMFRINPSDAREYQKTFGLPPVDGEAYAAAIRKAHLLQQAISAGASSNPRFRFFPYLVGEVIQDVVLHPSVSLRTLRDDTLEKRAKLYEWESGNGTPPLGLTLPSVVVGAALGGGSAAGVTLRSLGVAGGGQLTSDLIADGYRDFNQEKAYDNYQNVLRQADEQIAFTNLVYGYLYAGGNKNAGSMLDELAAEYGLPQLSTSTEDEIKAAVQSQFPAHRFRKWSEVLNRRSQDKADGPKSGEAPVTEDSPPQDQALAVFQGNMDELRNLNVSEFNENAWKATLFGVSGSLRAAQSFAAINNPKLASQIGRVGGAGLDIANAVFHYKVLTTGANAVQGSAAVWASVGMYTTAAAIGLSLLQGSQNDGMADAMKAIMEQIVALQRMVADLYEMTRDSFDHLNRRMESIHLSTMRAFDRLAVSLAAANRGVGVVLAQNNQTLIEISQVRSDLVALAVSEIDARYSPATCLLTARASYARIADRQQLFDRCMEVLVQQIYEPERSLVLVRGSGSVPTLKSPSDTIAGFLSVRENSGWFAPEREYPIVRSELPYYAFQLGSLASAVNGESPPRITLSNPQYWTKQADRVVQLIALNTDLYQTSPPGRVAVADLIGEGETLLGQMNYWKGQGRLGPTLDAVVSEMQRTLDGFASRIGSLEAAYFEMNEDQNAKYLNPLNTSRPQINFDDPTTRMRPCVKATRSWLPSREFEVPFEVRSAVPRTYLVAEAIGEGSLQACYRANYVADGFTSRWDYNSPNRRMFTISSMVETIIEVSFVVNAKEKDGKETVHPVLVRRAKSKEPVRRETLAMSRGCTKHPQFSLEAIPGTAEVDASYKPDGIRCRGLVGDDQVASLDSVLQSKPLSAVEWSWSDAEVKQVARVISQEVAKAAKGTRANFLRFVSGMLVSFPSSSAGVLPPDVSSAVRAALTSQYEYGELATHMLSRDDGLIQQLQALEVRRALLIALLDTFLPQWVADKELYNALYSEEWTSRVLDGPFFISLFSQIHAQEAGVAASIDEVLASQATIFTKLKGGVDRVVSDYAKSPAKEGADLTALRSRLGALREIN